MARHESMYGEDNLPPRGTGLQGGNKMPADFDKCEAEGGRIRRMILSKGRYMNVCYDKNNKSHAGEVKTKEK